MAVCGFLQGEPRSAAEGWRYPLQTRLHARLRARRLEAARLAVRLRSSPQLGTGHATGCYAAMKCALVMEAIFPINDRASAALMAIKADCLHKAGIISKREKQWVDSRVRAFLDDAELENAARSRSLGDPKRTATAPCPAALVRRGTGIKGAAPAESQLRHQVSFARGYNSR
jgi:hypothetical protein